MIIIDEFTDVSGLGVNRDKTRIVAARADGEGRDAEVWVLSRSCPWHNKGIQCAKWYIYLGILMGRGVTVGDVWRAVVMKAMDRLVTFGPAIRALPPHRRFDVFNIFIYPLFSYIAPFYSLPDFGEYSFNTIEKAIRIAILPFGYAGSKYAHYIAPTSTISPPTPLKDIWAGTKMTLMERVNLEQYHGVEDVTRPNSHYESMRTSTQEQEAARELVLFSIANEAATAPSGTTTKFNAKPFRVKNPAKRRRALYRVLVEAHMRWNRTDLDIMNKLKRRDLPSTGGDVERLKGHFCGFRSSLPRAVRFNQMCMLFNTLHTSRRTKHIRSAKCGDDEIDRCWLCNTEEDSIQHMYSDRCAVSSRARVLFGRLVCYDLSHHAIEAATFWHASFLSFPLKYKAQAHAIAILNRTIWYRVKKDFSKRGSTPEPAKAAASIASAAMLDWHAVRATGWKQPLYARLIAPHIKVGASGNRSAEQTAEALRQALVCLAEAGANDYLAYTDGSADPISKESGAGIVITRGSLRVEISVAIGCGTNNVGELWAIGAGLEWLRLHGESGVTAHFFSDSRHALDLVTARSRPTQDVDLVHVIRQAAVDHEHIRHVRYRWVAGHCGLQGNDDADALANRGTTGSKKGKGMPDWRQFASSTGNMLYNPYSSVCTEGK